MITVTAASGVQKPKLQLSSAPPMTSPTANFPSLLLPRHALPSKQKLLTICWSTYSCLASCTSLHHCIQLLTYPFILTLFTKTPLLMANVRLNLCSASCLALHCNIVAPKYVTLLSKPVTHCRLTFLSTVSKPCY